MNSIRGILTTFRVMAALGAGLMVVGALPAYADVSPAETQKAMEETQAGFRQIHAKVAPAVVSIASRMTEDDSSSNPFDNMFGGPSTPTPRTINASGSGVIIKKNGIVLTNSHVVANATKLTVTLSGSTKKLPAEVVAADPRTDLAIVRITEPGDYPVATLGNASGVEVGDWAIAFGSPFRLPTTMTLGVISATGRQLSSPDDSNRYRDLLQTDASINPGNSGGPLVNIRGEVIGINFMIYSPGSSSGSVGIGFAIPINDRTRNIIDLLAQGKSVERGRLGVAVKNLDETMRDQYGVPDGGGILVDGIAPGQAAEKAGVKAEDVIVTYNGTKINDIDQFVNMVETTAPGTKVTLTVIRDKKQQQITVTVGAIPAENKRAALNETKVGMSVTTITPEIATGLRLPVAGGVLVTKVQPGSAAEDAGFERGDIVVRVGSDTVNTEDEFWGALSKQMADAKHGVLLRVRKGDTVTTLTLPLLTDTDKKDNQ